MLTLFNITFHVKGIIYDKVKIHPNLLKRSDFPPSKLFFKIVYVELIINPSSFANPSIFTRFTRKVAQDIYVSMTSRHSIYLFKT